MPRYRVTQKRLVWEEAIVEADDEVAAADEAYAEGFDEIDSATRDLQVEAL